MSIYNLENPDRSLEMGAEQFLNYISNALQLILRFTHGSDRNTLPIFLNFDSKDISDFVKNIDEKPCVDFYINTTELYDLLSFGMNSNSAGYMSDIPGGGLLHSSIADLITSTLNRWPGLYEGAPTLIEIEKYVILWMCKLMGLTQTSAGGILTSGGSMANFNAIYLSRLIKLGNSFSHGTLYISNQTHHSITKAAKMAGIHPQRIRILPTRPDSTLSLTELVSTIQQDIQENLQPFLIVGNAGTTRFGAVDDLEKLAAIAHKFNCWYHVDAAWAGSFMLTERGKSLMRGIEKANSITIDPHKAFWTPWGSGAFLVANVEHLHSAFSIDADYLPFSNAKDLMLNPSVISGELSRSTRGLQMWLPLKLCGAEAFRNCLNEKLDLAEWAYEKLKSISSLHVIPPSLGIVSFRINLPGLDEAQTNIATQRVTEYFLIELKAYISGSSINNQYFAHLVPLHYKTHKPQVEYAIQIIELATNEIAKEFV